MASAIDEEGVLQSQYTGKKWRTGKSVAPPQVVI